MTKKTYGLAHYEPSADGFTLLLDGAPARTPLGNPLVIKTQPLAEEIVREWQAQADIIRKGAMPLTQIACVAIDLVGKQRDEVLADILPYAETDLVCYRAGDTPALAVEQEELLSPILAWAEEAFGVSFVITDGVMPVKQPATNREKFASRLRRYDDWKLAAFATCVKPLGSFVLALAFMEGRIDAAVAFQLAHLEESYETREWGSDEEKDAKMQKLREDIETTERFLKLLEA